jgi:hypothetical protein
MPEDKSCPAWEKISCPCCTDGRTTRAVPLLDRKGKERHGIPKYNLFAACCSYCCLLECSICCRTTCIYEHPHHCHVMGKYHYRIISLKWVVNLIKIIRSLNIWLILWNLRSRVHSCSFHVDTLCAPVSTYTVLAHIIRCNPSDLSSSFAWFLLWAWVSYNNRGIDLRFTWEDSRSWTFHSFLALYE